MNLDRCRDCHCYCIIKVVAANTMRSIGWSPFQFDVHLEEFTYLRVEVYTNVCLGLQDGLRESDKVAVFSMVVECL